MGVLFSAADKAVEWRRIASLQEGDRAAGISLSGMGHHKMVELPEHLAFAARQDIVPALPFLLPHHEKAVLFVKHICAHHPALVEREEEKPQLIGEIRLHGVLSGDMHAPGAIGHGFAGGARQ